LHLISSQMKGVPPQPTSANKSYNVDNLLTAASAVAQYNKGQNITADAKVNITPTTQHPSIGDLRLRLAYSNSVYRDAQFPRYSIGISGGAVAFNEGSAFDNDANGYADAASFFLANTPTKQLTLVDAVYRPTPYVRYGARISSDLGMAFHYEQRYADGLAIQATVHNGQTGVQGSPDNQRVVRPSLGVGITIGD